MDSPLQERPLLIHPKTPLRDLATLLRLRPRNQRLPEGSLEILLNILEFGANFAQDIIYEPLKDSFAMIVRDRDLSIQRIDGFISAILQHLRKTLDLRALKEPMESVSVAMFLFGMSSGAYSIDPHGTIDIRTFLTVRTLLQSALVKTFLALPEDQIRELHSSILRLQINSENWAKNSAGALAAARLAHAFLKAGALVYLLNPYYDAFHAGDLLVGGTGPWFYVQVKADRGSGEIKLAIPDQKTKDADQQKLLAGVRQFAADTDLTPVPLFATVGINDGQPGKVSVEVAERAANAFLTERARQLQQLTA